MEEVKDQEEEQSMVEGIKNIIKVGDTPQKQQIESKKATAHFLAVQSENPQIKKRFQDERIET